MAQVTIAIHNGSDELLGKARVVAFNQATGKQWPCTVAAGYVDPHSEDVVQLLLSNPFHPAQPSIGVSIQFCDAGGRWWKRCGSDPVERVHDDPYYVGGSPWHREQAKASAIARGLTPSQEPTVSLAVRLHRLARRLRGKSPIP